MKLKKIFIAACTTILVVLIYKSTSTYKINYLNIGDNNFYKSSLEIKRQLVDKDILNSYNSSFVSDNAHIIDIINIINNNEKENDRTIKNLLIKADIVTLSIGNNDLNRKNLNYEYIDEVMLDMSNLFDLLRKNCKEKIYISNFKNDNEYYIYANKRLQELCKKYNIKLLDINKNNYTDIVIENIK